MKETDLTLLGSHCILLARWISAVKAVEEQGQTIVITSTTRTGSTRKPIPNPAVKNEIAYAAALIRIARRFGLSPLDRPHVSVSPFEDKPVSSAPEDDFDDSDIFVTDGSFPR